MVVGGFSSAYIGKINLPLRAEGETKRMRMGIVPSQTQVKLGNSLNEFKATPFFWRDASLTSASYFCFSNTDF